MTRLTIRLAIAAFAIVLGVSYASASSSEVRAKRAECLREADAKHFGIHFIKRNRFIRSCLARH